MKDYATETDIITTADPLFYPGDVVVFSEHQGYKLTVHSVAWDILQNSWTYLLLYFTVKAGASPDLRAYGITTYFTAKISSYTVCHHHK